MLTAELIDTTKKAMRYSPQHQGIKPLHEHDDCIRIAWQWLDAQTKLRRRSRLFLPLKHFVEQWGERYVSQSDVEVAALLHPEVFGLYPHFNISRRLVVPSRHRLEGIGEAGRHTGYRGRYDDDHFYWWEAGDGTLTKKPAG